MNDVSLREYLEALMGEREKRVSQLENDAKIALKKAEEALEKRLDLLNEFRAQSVAEQARFVDRREFEGFQQVYRQAHEALKERVDIAAGGRAMIMSALSIGVAIAAIAVALLR